MKLGVFNEFVFGDFISKINISMSLVFLNFKFDNKYIKFSFVSLNSMFSYLYFIFKIQTFSKVFILSLRLRFKSHSHAFNNVKENV